MVNDVIAMLTAKMSKNQTVLHLSLRKSIGIGIEIMGLFARILNLIAIKLWSINSNKTTSLQHETSGV